MEKLYIVIILTLSLSLNAQQDNPSLQLGQKQHDLEKNSMITLTTWGGANLISGTIGSLSSNEGEANYFHQMNAGWGLINMGIGLSSLLFSKDPAVSNTEVVNRSHQTEKILLFNAGLDVAYVTGGFLLRSLANNNPENAIRFRGFGNSLLLQGGFLFVFDITQAILHQRLRKSIFTGDTGQLSLSTNGLGIKYTFR